MQTSLGTDSLSVCALSQHLSSGEVFWNPGDPGCADMDSIGLVQVGSLKELIK